MKPKDFSDLLSSDTVTTSGTIAVLVSGFKLWFRSVITLESFWKLKANRSLQQISDVNVEHVIGFIDDSLVDKSTMKIDTWPTWNLE